MRRKCVPANGALGALQLGDAVDVEYMIAASNKCERGDGSNLLQTHWTHVLGSSPSPLPGSHITVGGVAITPPFPLPLYLLWLRTICTGTGY